MKTPKLNHEDTELQSFFKDFLPLALSHAEAVNDERVKEFYPSLYLCLGKSYEELEDRSNAEKYYNLAAELGIIHTG